MKMPKSYWYYWYTGNKTVAVISMISSAALTGLVLALSIGFSLWGIMLAVLLDAVGFLVILIYVAVRSDLPSLVLEQTDAFMLDQFVIPLCIAFLLGRLITFWVAKLS